MSKISQRREKLAALRDVRDGAEQAAAEARAAYARAHRTLVAAEAQHDADAEPSAKLEQARLARQLAQAALSSAQSAAQDAVREHEDAHAQFLGDFDAAELVATLDADRPLALLPVRLETRFAPADGGGMQLLVRVFADELHSDTHEPELTDDERLWGEAYWHRIWSADDHSADAREAWAMLARHHGAARATWIVRALAPVNLDARPSRGTDGDPAPSFPPAGARAALWTRAAHTEVLPDRWCARGYVDGRRVVEAWGEPIADRVALGPSPHVSAPEGTLVDEDMRWLVDFDRAITTGMALRVPLPPDAADGLDRLVVTGVKTTLSADDAGARAARLLVAHDHTDGLSLVRQGEPAQEPPDARRTREPPDAGYEHSFRATRAKAPTPSSDAGRLALALGIDRTVFTRARIAGGREGRSAGAMNAALWPATLGYYVEQILDGAGADEISGPLRRHFVEHVRARGPLAALRTGRQPYGMLPVTSLARWTRRDPGEPSDRAAKLLRELCTRWREGLSTTPLVDASLPVERLAAVLAQAPVGRAYAARPAIGLEVQLNLDNYVGEDRLQASAGQRAAVATQLTELGLPPDPRPIGLSFWPTAAELRGPVVDRTLPADAPAPPWIAWLAETAYEQVLGERGSTGADDPSLLYLLLRHATLLAIVQGARAVEIAAGVADWRSWREPELPGFVLDRNGVPEVWERLSRLAPNDIGQKLGQYVDDARRYTGGGDELPAALQTAHRHGRALDALKGLTVGELDLLTRESLDLCSHRLDAWITSLATSRLATLRAQQPAGLNIGAWAVVENVRPAQPGGTPREQQTQHDPALGGFMHAPSVAHAVTAAVLRSGHLSHANAPTGAPLAVDLSSARVRDAQLLLDGVRQGQPLGALLGERFERALHDGAPAIELDAFIAPLRARAPLAPQRPTPSGGQPAEALAARTAVDGLALLRLHDARSIPWGDPAAELPPAGSPEHSAIVAELDALAAAVDAVADVLLAESVHHTVQGSATSAGATLDSVSRGEPPPAQLEITRTPRAATPISHRLAVMLSQSVEPSPDWPAEEHHLRRAADPRLDRWVGEQLGSPLRTYCRVTYLDERGAVLDRVRLPLAALDLSPLDVVALAAAPVPAGATELEQRVALCALSADQRPEGVPADASVSLVFDADPDAPVDELPLAQLVAAARAIAELLGAARPLDARTLAPLTGTAMNAQLDLTELTERRRALIAAIEQLVDEMVQILAIDKPFAGDLRALLASASLAGVPGTIATSADGDEPVDRTVLREQVTTALPELRERLRRAMTVAAGDIPSDPVETARHELEIMRQALPGLHALPLTGVSDPAQVDAALRASATLQGGDTLAASRWLHGIARVRAGARRLIDADALCAAATGRPPTALTAIQLPHTTNDRWVALSATDNGEGPDAAARVPAGRASIVLHALATYDLAVPVAGLLIDEWAEAVPAPTQTTAVSFHAPAPAAQAPQSVLIAVPPDNDGWSVDLLEEILLETLELVEMRTLEPDDVPLGQLLPALLFATNTNEPPVTASLDFNSVVT